MPSIKETQPLGILPTSRSDPLGAKDASSSASGSRWHLFGHKGELKAESQKVVAKIEESLGYRAVYQWSDHQQVSLQDFLNQSRECFPSLSSDAWGNLVQVRDCNGLEIDWGREVQQMQFPLFLQLPKQRELFHSLCQQQVQLAAEQKRFIEAQEHSLKEFQRQLKDELVELQQGTHKFIEELQAGMLAKTLHTRDVERTQNDEHHQKLLHEVQSLRSEHGDKASTAERIAKDIQDNASASKKVLEDIHEPMGQLFKMQSSLMPDISAQVNSISAEIRGFAPDLHVLPELFKELHVSVESIQSIAKELHSVPQVCSGIDSKCEQLQQLVLPLKTLPNALQATHQTCKIIQHSSEELKPMLMVAQQGKATCEQIQDGLARLKELPNICSGVASKCSDLEKLTSDLLPLLRMMIENRNTCDKIHDYVSLSLREEIKSLQTLGDENKVQAKDIADHISAVGRAVARSQPLTTEQYTSLTDTMQQVLAEMKNPIPQPKMSFANAVVHVHKDKKCDDIVDKGKPFTYRIEGQAQSGHSSQLSTVAPLLNLTGRLKKEKAPDRPQKKTVLPAASPQMSSTMKSSDLRE